MLPFHILRAGSSGISTKVPAGNDMTALAEGPNGFLATYGTDTTASFQAFTTIPNNTLAINSGSGWITTPLSFTNRVVGIANGSVNTIVLLTPHYVFTSTNGGNSFSQTLAFTASDATGVGIVFAAGQYVVQTSGFYSYTSTDGISWTRGSLQTESVFYTMTSGSVYFATPSFFQAGMNYLQATSEYISCALLTYNNAVAGGGCALFRSTDGLSWKAPLIYNYGTNGSKPCGVAASPTVVVVCGQASNSFCYTGSSQSTITNPTTYGFYSIIWDGATFYAADPSANLFSSASGTNSWSATGTSSVYSRRMTTDGISYYSGNDFSGGGGITDFSP